MLSTRLSDKELKSHLVKEIHKLDREKLLILYQTISRLVAEELIDAVSKDWETGKVNRQRIQEAIDEFRSDQPFGKTP